MFIFWSTLSWAIVFATVFFWFFISLESPLFLWFFLEGSVWGSFFFFLSGEEEKNSNNSLSFFVVQGACSLIWILLSTSEGELNDLLIPLVIYLNMGLIPGHLWAWSIYESGNYFLIWIISFFQKILPLGMLYLSLESGLNSPFFINFLVVYNLVVISYLLLNEINLNLFLLISSIMHFNNIVILMVNEKLLEVAYYFLSYSLLLLLTLNFSYLYGKSLSSPEGGSPSWGEGVWIVSGFSIVGFPPSLIFFINLLFLLNMGNVLNSVFIMTFLLVILLYMLLLVSSTLNFMHLSSSSLSGSYISLEWSQKLEKFPIVLILISFSLIVLILISFSPLVSGEKSKNKVSSENENHVGGVYT